MADMPPDYVRTEFSPLSVHRLEPQTVCTIPFRRITRPTFAPVLARPETLNKIRYVVLADQMSIRSRT
jgi:hypothetical protein